MARDTVMATKFCNRCGEDKPATREFFSPSKGAWKSTCKVCTAETTAIYRSRFSKAELAEKERRYRFKRVYGITPEQWDEMKEAQQGLCAICKTEPDVLAVDHCHKTGRVRGLLCHTCNRALGLFGDSFDRIVEAAVYLKAGDN